MSEFTFKQLIGGAWVNAHSGGTWDLINPATEEVLGVMPFGDRNDAEAAIDHAAKAFPQWSHTTPYERAEILMKAAEWILARVDTLAAISTEECGKPLRESTAEWRSAANHFRWFAEECKRAYGRIIPSRVGARRIMVLRQPVGVVGTITAWNFPVYNVVRTWGAALAAGCTVVGKPSEYTPRSAMLLAQALHDSGTPAGVINLVNGDAASIGQAMLDDPRCRKISFTGSTRVGKLLLEGSAKTVTRLALELGGNAPVIVFPDVKNIEQVARDAVTFKYRNAGQVCISPQRFYVHSRIAEEFIDHVTHLSQTMKVGNGLDTATDTGPLINKTQLARVEAIVNGAAAGGAQVLTGGSRPVDMPHGYFFSPTVITNLAPSMDVYRQEIFGPVMPIIPFSDIDEALALANATEYGLAAYVQTGDLNTAIRMYEELEYGMVAVNDWLPSTPEAPFGGVKQSGIGRENGLEGFADYLETKTVFVGNIG
jgi:succinate-semialdehyde dehydrogenase